MDINSFSHGLNIFALAFVPALFGIICHEVAHGWVASLQGDPTAKMMGRLTLNPIKHLDPMGTAIFAFTAIFTPFVLGWAKPVPVNARYFRRPRQGMLLVAIAGPFTNLLVALLCAFIFRFTLLPENNVSAFINEAAAYGISINCTLAWFNLLPVPPLDGSHVVAGLLPERFATQYEKIGRYGMLIVIGLLATGVFWRVLQPLIKQSISLILTIAGL